MKFKMVLKFILGLNVLLLNSSLFCAVYNAKLVKTQIDLKTTSDDKYTFADGRIATCHEVNKVLNFGVYLPNFKDCLCIILVDYNIKKPFQFGISDDLKYLAIMKENQKYIFKIGSEFFCTIL